MYYKISVNAGGLNSYEYLEAENEEHAKEALAEMIRDFKGFPNDLAKDEEIQSSIREVSIDECIAEEKLMRTLDMERLYVQLHYDFNTLTVAEYGRLKKTMRSDLHTKWLILKDFNGLQRQYTFLEKACDLQKMPAAVYLETARKLHLTTGTPAFEEIATEICRQYGKEAFRCGEK